MKVLTIAAKELREYVLKPGSISWGVVFPLVFTLAFAVRFGDIDHLAPGLLSISILFGTSSFVSSSIIFERRLRTFERLLVAPVTYLEIAAAKILVGTLFGLFVGITSMLVLRLFMAYPVWNWGLLLLFMLLSGLTFSALSLYVSLIPQNPINAMTWLNLIRLPMIFTSGAIVSLLLFPRWFLAIGLLTPMTYSVEGLRFSMLEYYDVVNPAYSALVMVILTMVLLHLAIRSIKSLY